MAFPVAKIPTISLVDISLSTVIELNIGEIDIETKDNYHNLLSSSNGKTQNTGEPEIPTYSFSYSINREKEYDVEIIKDEYVLYENINLFPSQPLLKVGEDEIFIKDIWLETNIPIKVPSTEKCKIRVNI